MKVLVRYQDNEDDTKHKTLKITLPKSWKSGPTSRLLDFFVESYNSNFEDENSKLSANDLHLELKQQGSSAVDSTIVLLASDDVIIECIEDRQDIFVMHGASQKRDDLNHIKNEKQALLDKEKQNTVACVHFGCQQRFPKEGPYPKCVHHKSPPIFHETAKYWSCCPHKKAYDWDGFQSIPGCQAGTCSHVRADNNSKEFLGGCDVREAVSGPTKLLSIDDFNKQEQQVPTMDPQAEVLDRLRLILEELGVEKELFDQVVTGIKRDILATDIGSSLSGTTNDSMIAKEASVRLGKKLKDTMKAIATEQLRIQ
mmetsp:Transcript_6076/g.8873  ORF Transcript_6076/g.8873 Transcript_6076/m.8873 type:complete len:312 (+) Transcript_6076:68-1003(+)